MDEVEVELDGASQVVPDFIKGSVHHVQLSLEPEHVAHIESQESQVLVVLFAKMAPTPQFGTVLQDLVPMSNQGFSPPRSQVRQLMASPRSQV